MCNPSFAAPLLLLLMNFKNETLIDKQSLNYWKIFSQKILFYSWLTSATSVSVNQISPIG